MSRRSRKQKEKEEIEEEMEVSDKEIEEEDQEDADRMAEDEEAKADPDTKEPEAQNADADAPASQQQSYRPQEKRLIITKMVLENFKSYAGRQEIGPLHHCFSAVVGPNGSGKSNVIDAVLFVFGRQAKKLRLNKVSEFIHNSEHQRNLTQAKVSVHFEEIYNDVRPFSVDLDWFYLFSHALDLCRETTPLRAQCLDLSSCSHALPELIIRPSISWTTKK